MAAGQSRGQLATEKVGIRSGDQAIVAFTMQPVEERFPAREVLDLIEKIILGCGVDLLKRRNDVVTSGLLGKKLVQPILLKLQLALPL